MNPPPEEFSRAEAELQILRALCQETPPGSLRDMAGRMLGNYHWQEPVHQAVFRCLLQFPAGTPDFLRIELPACLTRKGFPDVDWGTLFAPHSLTTKQAARLMRQLRKSQVRCSTRSRQ
jgi:hypothetical protein